MLCWALHTSHATSCAGIQYNHGGGPRCIPTNASAFDFHTQLREALIHRRALTAAEWAAFERRFAALQGGWCCAPPRDRRRGMPNNVGFHILRV